MLSGTANAVPFFMPRKEVMTTYEYIFAVPAIY